MKTEKKIVVIKEGTWSVSDRTPSGFVSHCFNKAASGSFRYSRNNDGTRTIRFQMLTPQSKVSYEINEVFPGNSAVAVVTKSADRQLLKKNGFVSAVNKSCYIQDHFFLTVYKVLKQVRALQNEFGADTVKVSTVFHWTEL